MVVRMSLIESFWFGLRRVLCGGDGATVLAKVLTRDMKIPED